jgi:Na+/proline symporter
VDIYSTAILVSLIIYIAVGNYAGRRVKKLDDYFVAGRRAPTLLIVGTFVSSLISTDAYREIIILSAGPLLWIATALFAWWMIRKSYR